MFLEFVFSDIFFLNEKKNKKNILFFIFKSLFVWCLFPGITVFIITAIVLLLDDEDAGHSRGLHGS